LKYGGLGFLLGDGNLNYGADEPALKYSAVPLKKVGFSDEESPSFLIPSICSQRLLNPRNPQTFARGFSFKLKVGRRISCSTFSLRSSGATK
jgi:hypothetical protein